MASNTVKQVNYRHQESLLEVSSYYSATIWMFVLGSSGVGLAVIPLLLFSDNESATSQDVYGLLRILSFIALIILCCCLLWYKRRRIAHGSWTHGNPRIHRWLEESGGIGSENQQAKYMMFTLFLFGIGSIIWCVLKIILTPTLYWVYVDNVLNIISLIAQLVFFYDFIRERLPNLKILHYAISTMIGIKMWSWIGAILEPLWDFDDFDDVTEGTEDILEFSEEFFEPFYVEFSTIAVGVLFGVWHSMKKIDKEGGQEQPNHLSVGDLGHYIPGSDSSDDEDSFMLRQHPPRSLQNKKVIITAATFIGITFTLVSSLATIDEVIPDLTTRVYIYRGVTVIFFAPLVLLSIFLLKRIGPLPSVEASFINGNEYVLLFTACSESIYYILRAVAAIGYFSVVKSSHLTPAFAPNATTISPEELESLSLSHQKDHVYDSNYLATLFLVYSVVKFCEAWLQSRLLIVARRKEVPEYVKNCLTFFVAINLSEWLKSGILLGLGRKHRSNFNPMMDAFYGPSATITIILILLPIMILFRFHAAIVAVEIINET